MCVCVGVISSVIVMGKECTRWCWIFKVTTPSMRTPTVILLGICLPLSYIDVVMALSAAVALLCALASLPSSIIWGAAVIAGVKVISSIDNRETR